MFFLNFRDILLNLLNPLTELLELFDDQLMYKKQIFNWCSETSNGEESTAFLVLLDIF